MNTMVPSLASDEMSASDPNSKVDVLDSLDVVKKKRRAGFCEEGNVEEYGVLAFVGAVLFPISQPRLSRQESWEIEPGVGDQRAFVSEDTFPGAVYANFGRPSHYSSFEKSKEEFRETKVDPGDLKASVRSGINRPLEPIRKVLQGDEEWKGWRIIGWGG